jgi:hypothetical protein
MPHGDGIERPAHALTHYRWPQAQLARAEAYVVGDGRGEELRLWMLEKQPDTTT